jgi:hypothetical protein
VDRKHQETEKEVIKPLLSVEFGEDIHLLSIPSTHSKYIENGSVKDIDIADKTSGTILQELLALDRSV